jgi:hypothetical protein
MKRFAMNIFVWGIVCAGILALPACGTGAAADNDPAILQSDKAFVQALANHDQAAVSKVLDKDFIWYKNPRSGQHNWGGCANPQLSRLPAGARSSNK